MSKPDAVTSFNEREIAEILRRNARVEADKAWETSKSRRALVALFTYIAIGLYLKYVVGINPWINAIVPSLGFLLSTLTLPYFKQLWLKYAYQAADRP